MAGMGCALTVAAVVTVGCGVAQASSPLSVVGQKYSDADTTLNTAGYAVVVSTTVGDQLPRPDCIVVNQQPRTEAAQENSSASPTNQMLLSLNCDAALASAKSPGNSLESPQGRAAKAAEAASTASAKT